MYVNPVPSMRYKLCSEGAIEVFLIESNQLNTENAAKPLSELLIFHVNSRINRIDG